MEIERQEYKFFCPYCKKNIKIKKRTFRVAFENELQFIVTVNGSHTEECGPVNNVVNEEFVQYLCANCERKVRLTLCGHI